MSIGVFLILSGIGIFVSGFLVGVKHHRCHREDAKIKKRTDALRMMALGIKPPREGSARGESKQKNNRADVRRNLLENDVPDLRRRGMVGDN